MRVVSLNCNGIRAASGKGLYEWLRSADPDVVCLQETKAQEHQLPFDAGPLTAYASAFEDAERPGYSGVAILSRKEPDAIVFGLGWPDFDREGRFVQFDFGSLSIASLYLPSGASGEARRRVKDEFMTRFATRLDEMLGDGRSYIVAGDFNVAHRAVDVYDPVRCAKISGFLPHERAWMDRVLATGWCDAFRELDASAGQYTYWSNFQEAFAKNNGWRIDYQLVTPDMRQRLRGAFIYKDRRFSDHAPLVVDYEPCA